MQTTKLRLVSETLTGEKLDLTNLLSKDLITYEDDIINITKINHHVYVKGLAVGFATISLKYSDDVFVDIEISPIPITVTVEGAVYSTLNATIDNNLELTYNIQQGLTNTGDSAFVIATLKGSDNSQSNYKQTSIMWHQITLDCFL